jgi:AcrR family transcriptional regulator
MARPVRHHADAIIEATLAVASTVEMEAVTIAAVSRASGAPSGSIYHRFASRDRLLGAAWLDATKSFQAGFLANLQESSKQPGLAAALYTVGWSRRQPHRARALVLHRALDFGSRRWSEEQRAEARRAAAALEEGLTEFSIAGFGASGGEVRRRVTFALLDLPYAAVRRYLAAGIAPPPEVDGYVEEALGVLFAGPPRD